jgi:hypothetical protein
VFEKNATKDVSVRHVALGIASSQDVSTRTATTDMFVRKASADVSVRNACV